MLKSKEVSTCLIIVKLHSCVYRTSPDRTVAINCHKCLDTLFAERCMSTWHESNVFACCNITCGGNWSSCWCNSCCRCNFTVAVSIVFVISKVVLLRENASRPTFVRPISVSHLGLFHARTIVSSRSQCYFSRISSNCTVIPYSIFPYLHFPTLLTRTLIFRTCVFHPCVAVLEFSVLVFSIRTHFATLYFSFPYLHFPVLAISAPPLHHIILDSQYLFPRLALFYNHNYKSARKKPTLILDHGYMWNKTFAKHLQWCFSVTTSKNVCKTFLQMF